MQFERLNWAILDRLREGFLSGAAANGVYWKSHDDLDQYDQTFGERIGWKWDAVLAETSARGWRPSGEALTMLDWGCGSGVAGRRVMAHFGEQRFARLLVWDHSPLAREFAAARARELFPNLTISEYSETAYAGKTKRAATGPGAAFVPQATKVDVLVVSHVLNELDSAARETLLELMRAAQQVLWVEPGTHALSRDLISFREKLRGEFRIVAPCTHNAVCGLLAPQNAQHWCHAHAAPPPSLYADSDWVKFGQRAGIDLRSLPYSFLIMEKLPQPVALPPDGSDPIPRQPVIEAGAERIIDEPRHFKGYAKVLSSAAVGVRDLMLQKRDEPELFKQLKRELGVPIYRWSLDGDRIRNGQALYPPKTASADERI
jgi:SAM-dependent methyltransferase